MSKKQLLSSIPTWIFDPQPPSGRPEGGFESIKNTGKLSELEIIIRESIQNSKDRMLNNTLNMTYKLFELDGNFKEEYLRNLNFKELEPHLKASTDVNLTSGESKHIKKGLNVLKIKKSKLRILVIEDNNCEGLTGKEDDDTSNFVLLCKGNMATTPKGFKGGSWGVGKKSFLETSGIRTLLFSSIPKDTKKIRIFGRTITPSHTTSDGNKFSTAGFFGIPNKEGNAAESFNDANLAKKLLIGREEGNTGTSIAIICFNDSTTNFDEFTAKVEDFIQKYYWPVLENLLPEQKKLNVKIERFENNSKKSSKTINEVTISKYKNFLKAYIGINKADNVEKENTSTTAEIKFKINERETASEAVEIHKNFNTNLQLDIYRGSLGDVNLNGSANKTAFIRGFGQVVKYFDSKVPHGPLPYFAVLSTGKAKNKINQDSLQIQYEEEFFRMLENELHDDWINQKNFKAFYKKPSSVTPEIKSMENQIITRIRKLCGVDASSGTKGPKGIANELSLKGGGGEGPTGEKIYKVYAEGYDDGEKIESLLPNGTLNLRYKIKKKSEILSDTKVKLDYTLRSDSGETIKIPFDKITISHNKKPIEWELINNQIRFLMPENIFEVDFLAIANPGILKDNSNEEFNGYDFKKIALKRTLLSFK